MGRVVAANYLKDIMDVKVRRESIEVLHTIKHLGCKFDAHKFWEEVFYLNKSPRFNLDKKVEITALLFQETTSSTLEELSESWDSHDLLRVMRQQLRYEAAQVFITDKGFLGLGGYLRKDIKHCVVKGLFGADIPFLLRELKPEDEVREATIYTIVDSAQILGHEHRNAHFENLAPGADWKDLVRSGKVEGFKIV